MESQKVSQQDASARMKPAPALFGGPDDRERMEVLRGDLHGHHALKSKVIRIFTSSTFSDTKVERDMLMETVYPCLKSYCRSLGLDFQIVDMRWGVRDESVDEHLIVDLCLAEIKLCQEISVGPQFVTFLGQKYGFRPLKASISASDFKALLTAIDDQETKSILYQWYKLDENVIPPSFILQPISSTLPHYYDEDPKRMNEKAADRAKWFQLQDLMTKALRRAARSVFKDRSRVQDYLSSVTEIEINQGIFQCPGNPSHHCWWLKREFSNLQKSVTSDPLAASYIDVIYGTREVDKEAQSLLTMLKEDRIPARYLGIRESNILTYPLQWQPGGLNPNKNPDHAEYVQRFCSDFYRVMVKAIGAAHASYLLHAGDPLYQEVLQHARFCKAKCKLFQGRDGVLSEVDSYLSSRNNYPLIIHGESGCGKTSVLAAGASRLQKRLGTRCVLVLRFLGTTAASLTARRLLSSVCHQICTSYNHDSFSVPESYKDLSEYFPQVMAFATEELPLYVFLDSIDQLSDESDGRQAAWLPVQLPPNVHLVVSTLTDPKYKCFPALRLRLNNKDNAFALIPSLTPVECDRVFNHWLTHSKRTLTQRQSEFVLRRFKDCPLPLYLRLAFNEAIRWKSYSHVDDILLPSTVRATILRLFDRLEKMHGRKLVSHSLGYLTAAKDGLSEAELEDILSCDDEVLSDVYQYWTPTVRRLPPLLWSHVRHDLGEFLVDSAGGDGSRVIRWFHRQFEEASRERYLGDRETRRARHSAIADFFQGRWSGPTKKPWIDGDDTGCCRMVAEQPLTYGDEFNHRKLTELPWNLAESGRTSELENDLLSNYEWLLTKLLATSVSAVIADFSFVVPSVSATRLESGAVSELRLIVEALRLAANAVSADPDHLPSQLVGRLMLLAAGDEQKKRPLVAKLFSQAKRCPSPSILPLLPCFPTPGGPLQTSLQGHRNFVSSVAVVAKKRSDGMEAEELVVVSGSWDGTVKAWDLDSGNVVETMEGHADWVTDVAVTGDGLHVLSSSADGTIRHWTLGFCEGPRGILRGHKGAVNAVAMTSDGFKAISGGDDKVLRVWNADLQSQMYGQMAFSLTGHSASVTSLRLTCDDSLLVSGSKDKTVRIWDVKLGQLMKTLEGHTASVTSVSVAGKINDRRLFISGSEDRTARLWNVQSGQTSVILRGHDDRVQAVDVIAERGIAVTGSVDKTVRVWKTETGTCIRVFSGHRGAVCGLSVAPDLRHVISASADDTLRAWALDSVAPSYQLPSHRNTVTSVSVSSDGRLVATSSLDSTAKIYALSGNELCDARLLSGHVGSVECVAFSSDGRSIMTASVDHNLKLWDAVTGRTVRTYCKHVDWVNAVVFAENDRLAVSASDDGSVVTWDVATGRAVRSWRAVDGYGDAVKTVDCLRTTSRHLILSGGTDGSVRVWDFESGVVVHVMTGHGKEVRYVKASDVPTPTVFSASRDKTMKMWSLDSGVCLRTFYGHKLPINVVVSLGDGEHVLSGSSDKTIRLWSVTSGACRASMYAESGVTALGVTPGGKRIAFGTNDGWAATAWLRLSENDEHMVIDDIAVLRNSAECSSSSERKGSLGGGESMRNGNTEPIKASTELSESVVVKSKGKAEVAANNEQPVAERDSTNRVENEERAETVEVLLTPTPSGQKDGEPRGGREL
eukprot:m.64383 g.64383  ORF g.64383 m.64383 type:complete len:1662 (+) comp35248_c0_seq9:54-5039(+)